MSVLMDLRGLKLAALASCVVFFHVVPNGQAWLGFTPQGLPFLFCRRAISGNRPSVPHYQVIRTGGLTTAWASAVDLTASPEPLASVLRSRLSELELGRFEALAQAAEGRPGSNARQRRNFGEVGQLGHEVIFLHKDLSLEDRALLWECAKDADAVMKAWGGITTRLGATLPALRCCEAISYSGLERYKDSLGWHNDGTTLFTVVVGLSSAGVDFEGGELEVQGLEQQSQLVTDLRRGDVVVFRGWDRHRVCSCRSGLRKVIVSEWWLGKECSDEEVRPRDTEETARKIVELDKTSFEAHVILAQRLLDRTAFLEAAQVVDAASRINPNSSLWERYFLVVVLDLAKYSLAFLIIAGLCRQLFSSGA